MTAGDQVRGYTMALYVIPAMGGVLIEMIYFVKTVRVKHEKTRNIRYGY
jgi:hypothetical protein